LRKQIRESVEHIILSFCVGGNTCFIARYNQFPSGLPDTTAINGCGNIVRSDTVIVGAGLEKGLSLERIFLELDRNFKHVVNGDDSLIVFNPNIDWFDRLKRKFYLELYFQMKLTSSTKGEVCPGTTALEDAQYNSRTFATLKGNSIFEGTIVSLLKKDSLFDIPMYVTTSKPELEAFSDNVEAAARFLAFYTPGNSGSIRDKTLDYWNRALLESGLPMIKISPDVIILDFLKKF
jgi:hypothetical protein